MRMFLVRRWSVSEEGEKKWERLKEGNIREKRKDREHEWRGYS